MARLPMRAAAQFARPVWEFHRRPLAVRTAGFRNSTRGLHASTPKAILPSLFSVATLVWPPKQLCAHMLDQQGQRTPR
jgi:hypothetical protein